MNDDLTISTMAKAVHGLAWAKGFHSTDESEEHFIERACNNLHDEISELHEAWRNNQLRMPCDKAEAMKAAGIQPLTCLEEELADIAIRAFDAAGKLGVDIAGCMVRKHTFNATRSHRHGGKLS
jgi:hypothetical protein